MVATRFKPVYDNEYWKRGVGWVPVYTREEKRAKLQEKGYPMRNNATHAELDQAWQRSRYGFQFYLALSDSQLRDIIREKNIDPKLGMVQRFKGQRRELIAALEYDFDHPKFYRFTSLPTELRMRIYEFYMPGLRHPRAVLNAPAQPPLTLTCRLIREEALPLFYSMHKFDICYYEPTDYEQLQRIKNTRHWMQHLAPTNVANMLHFCVYVQPPNRHIRRYPELGPTILRIDVDLTKAEDENGRLSVYTPCIDDPMQGGVRKAALRVLRGVVVKAGTEGRRLQREDIFNLKKEVELFAAHSLELAR